MTQQGKKKWADGRIGAALAIRVTTGTKKNEIVGIEQDGTVKIRLTARPIDGRANAMLIKYLSQILEVPRSNIEIIIGEASRNKVVSVLDIDAYSVQERLLKFIDHSG